MAPAIRVLVLLGWVAGNWIPATAIAHDIGVSKAELKETVAGQVYRYRLRVVSGAANSSRFPSPELPAHCQLSGNPRGVQGGGWKTYEFQCEGGLGVGDALKLPWLRDGIMLAVHWKDGSQVQGLFSYDAGQITVPLEELQVGSGSLLIAAKRYTVLGIEHILEGYDHLLFVFALLFIVNGGWLLVKTITAFTVAHSITLALATLGFVNFPSRPVEATIALSIVFLALEIVHRTRGRVGLTCRKPWLVAFAFGLLHGFGFAGALSDIGVPESEVPTALLFFNVGVEIGQLMFVAVVLLLKILLDRVMTWRPAVQTVLSAYLIGTVAMYWLIERILSMVGTPA